MCKRSKAFLSGIQKTSNSVQLFDRYRLPCKSFECPECAPQKTKIVKARIFNGRINDPQARQKKFSAKFLTLTAPGKDFREKHTTEQALDIMQSNYNKLMTNIRRHYGKVDFFRVTEPQKDGYPHFHLLLVGPTITEKGVYRHIENMWRSNYGMGFVKIRVVHNVKHGVNYMCKYLTKSLKSIKKYQRIFTASRGALAPMRKKESTWMDYRNVMFQYAGISSPGAIYNIPMEKIESLDLVDLLSDVKSFEDLQEKIEILKEIGELLPITNND